MSHHHIIKIGMGYRRANRLIEMIDRLQKYAVLEDDKTDLEQLKNRILQGIAEMERYN